MSGWALHAASVIAGAGAAGIYGTGASGFASGALLGAAASLLAPRNAGGWRGGALRALLIFNPMLHAGLPASALLLLARSLFWHMARRDESSLIALSLAVALAAAAAPATLWLSGAALTLAPFWSRWGRSPARLAGIALILAAPTLFLGGAALALDALSIARLAPLDIPDLPPLALVAVAAGSAWTLSGKNGSLIGAGALFLFAATPHGALLACAESALRTLARAAM